MAEVTERYPCNNCQATDEVSEDPMVHYAAEHYHYDCCPQYVLDAMLGDQETGRQKALAKLVAHAVGTDEDHLHGDDLRKKVVELMTKVNKQEAKDNG